MERYIFLVLSWDLGYPWIDRLVEMLWKDGLHRNGFGPY